MAGERCLGVILILTLLATVAAAQRSITDGTTPAGIAPGAPAGTYPLSDVDQINFYSGSLNFSLPLLTVGGRGDAGYTMMLPLRPQRWTVRHELFNQSFYRHYPTGSWWIPVPTAYMPGVLIGRMVGDGPCPIDGPHPSGTLTRLTFVTPDGSEVELLDRQTGGQVTTNYCVLGAGSEGASRGTVFVATDGSGMTFVSDTPIRDHIVTSTQIFPTGYLLFKNGTRYRIVNSKVRWIRDRNGNQVTFTYTNETPSNRLTKITDALKREITILYDQNEGQYGQHDKIIYKRFGGQADQIIRVSRSGGLVNALREDQSLKTFGQLFGLEDYGGITYEGGGEISSVWLPDGIRRYRLLYNSYGELARVVLPTGGAIEYDWGASLHNGDPKGVVLVDTIFGTTQEYAPEIFRRVLERRVYPNGAQGPNYESRMTISQTVGQGTAASSTTVNHYDAGGQLLARQTHHFHGNPIPQMNSLIFEYPGWSDGKEYQTDIYDIVHNTAVLKRQVNNAWQSGAPSPPVGQIVNPRIGETVTRLADTNPHRVSKQTFGYDQFNNLTDTWEYDFGAGEAGALLRRSHTGYVTFNNGFDYTAHDVHLRSLPSEQWVASDVGGTNKRSLTVYEYDNYGSDDTHAPLVPRSNITAMCTYFAGGVCSATGPGGQTPAQYTKRGNATGVTSYADAANLTGPATTAAQYDVAGNVVKTFDAHSVASEQYYATTLDFDDRFGVADDEARANSAPAQLEGQVTYAFLTKVTNALGHTAYSQFDYSTGLMVNAEDPNGTVGSVRYDDLLGRPTRAERAVNVAALRSQTTFSYDDAARKITTTSDLYNFEDNLFKSETLYDGLGRSVETRRYETGTQYAATLMKYDVLGRSSEVSNPYRPTLGEAPVWTKTDYDAMGRVHKVTTPDGAKAYNLYDGTRTLVTDQAGKQRLSDMDALGRLTEVWEVRSADPATGTEAVSFPTTPEVPAVTAGYRTAYTYDALGNLHKVRQQAGQVVQQRFFAYDSLSRLIRARHPEQDALAALALPAHLLTPLSDNNNDWSLSFEYDEVGNLKKKRDSRGVVTEHGHDQLNRPTGKTYTNDPTNTPPVKFFYDAQPLPAGAPAFDRRKSVGRLVAVTYGGAGSTTGSYVGEYDELGRAGFGAQVTAVNNANGQPVPQTYTTHYSYHLSGSLKTQTYPSGKVVESQYDTVGRLSGVKLQGGDYYAGGDPGVPGNPNVIRYAAHGGMTQLRLGNGLWEETQFNTRLQPETIKLGTTGGAANRWQVAYGYGAAGANNGKMREQTITVPTVGAATGFTAVQSYTYDDLNRLAQARETKDTSAGAENWKQVYKYDRFGNRTLDGGTSYPATLNEASNPAIRPEDNRISSAGYDYNPAGDVECDPLHPCGPGGAPYFTYNADNRLSLVQGGATASGGATYYYDGAGHRVKKVLPSQTTVYVYDLAGKLVAEYSNQTAANGVSYLTRDHLGSTRVVTDGNGQPRARHDYLPYGNEAPTVAGGRDSNQGYIFDADTVRKKFTGYERDGETSLDYAVNRYYNSSLGRFTSPDPLLASGNAAQPQTWNRYAYVANDPLNNVDPLGLKLDDAYPVFRDRRTRTGRFTAEAEAAHDERLREEEEQEQQPQQPATATGPYVDPVAFEAEFGPPPPPRVPRGTMSVRMGIQENYDDNIDDECGTRPAGACVVNPAAAMVTTTATNGQEWRARNVDFRVYGEMWISNGPFPYMGRVPVDRTVVDSASARAHEYNTHINVAIDAVRPEINRFLDRTFSSEQEFNAARDQTAARVQQLFNRTLRDTQRQENQRR